MLWRKAQNNLAVGKCWDDVPQGSVSFQLLLARSGRNRVYWGKFSAVPTLVFLPVSLVAAWLREDFETDACRWDCPLAG